MPLTTGPIVGLFVGRHVGAWAWSDRKAPLAAAIRALLNNIHASY